MDKLANKAGNLLFHTLAFHKLGFFTLGFLTGAEPPLYDIYSCNFSVSENKPNKVLRSQVKVHVSIEQHEPPQDQKQEHGELRIFAKKQPGIATVGGLMEQCKESGQVPVRMRLKKKIEQRVN